MVRNGNVIEVRAGVAERLRGAAAEERPDIVVVDTPMMRTITGSEGRPLTPHDVATIQVKSGSGKQTLIVKLKYNDTIGTLRSFIDDNRCVRVAPPSAVAWACSRHRVDGCFFPQYVRGSLRTAHGVPSKAVRRPVRDVERRWTGPQRHRDAEGGRQLLMRLGWCGACDQKEGAAQQTEERSTFTTGGAL